jgi:ferredoxin--NADP+ reductase
MATIIDVDEIAPAFKRYLVHDPVVAARHRAGQFVMVLLHDRAERIPLTIADSDAAKGTITLVVQEIGKTTLEMGTLRPGDSIEVAGPLGQPTHIEKWGTCVCVGGGAGIAPLLPIARAMRDAGNHVVSILGGRTDELVILRPEMEAVSDEIYYTTDDGSFGVKGFVTQALAKYIEVSGNPGIVVAIGPAPMMRAVAEQTRPMAIPTQVSLNTIMVDGTGMCGGCRVPIGGTSRFVCVEGPEFDGHQVDFDTLMKRQRIYLEHEELARRRYLEKHRCRALAAGGSIDGKRTDKKGASSDSASTDAHARSDRANLQL